MCKPTRLISEHNLQQGKCIFELSLVSFQYCLIRVVANWYATQACMFQCTSPDTDINSEHVSITTHVMFSGNHTCNGGAPRTAILGSNITYTCNFIYRGKRVEPLVWEGPGVTEAIKVSNVTQSPQQISTDCYTGKLPCM